MDKEHRHCSICQWKRTFLTMNRLFWQSDCDSMISAEPKSILTFNQIRDGIAATPTPLGSPPPSPPLRWPSTPTPTSRMGRSDTRALPWLGHRTPVDQYSLYSVQFLINARKARVWLDFDLCSEHIHYSTSNLKSRILLDFNFHSENSLFSNSWPFMKASLKDLSDLVLLLIE